MSDTTKGGGGKGRGGQGFGKGRGPGGGSRGGPGGQGRPGGKPPFAGRGESAGKAPSRPGRAERAGQAHPSAGKPRFGKRPDGARAEGGRSDGPAGEKPRFGKPGGFAGDKPRFDKPRGERPGGERPRTDRPRGERPTGERPKFDRARSDRPAGEAPRAERPYRDGPRPERGEAGLETRERRAFRAPRGRDEASQEAAPREARAERAPRPERSERPNRAHERTPDGERPRGRGRPEAPRDVAPARDGEVPRKAEVSAAPETAPEPKVERAAWAPQPASERPERPARAPRPARADDGETPAQKREFRPKSRGMLSHGGARDGEGEAPRRSTGRREPDGVVTQKPDRPRPPRREMREPDAGEESARGVETMRIAKRLARAGIASRREAEGMIADGRIAVNGKVLESPALDVTAKDRIEIDGQPIPAIERTRLWLFHKPAGTVTTNHDPEGRPTVFDRLPEDMPRVLSVGRLDINTEGLLLLTNDGGLARMLELPATGWLRRYRVRAHGEIDQARLDELRQGIAVDGVFYGAIEATLDRTQGANVWLSIGLREGKNREVKRVLGHLGLEVNRLIRLSFGPFQLADLEEGAVREIKGRTLRDQLGERLIEESGADFDAPVVNAFSNKPVKAEPTPALAPKPQKRGDWISASDTAPNRKRAREDKRDDALGRLDTRPGRSGGEGRSFGARPEREGGFDGPKKSFGERKPFGDKKPFGERKPFGGRDDKAGGPPRAPAAPRRSANVWMAPGARPRKADEGEAEGGRPRGEGGFKPRSEGGAKPGFQGPKRPVSPGGPKRPPRGRG